MSSNKSIGGYFEIEINNKGSLYHKDAVALNSGRNAFEYILRQKKYSNLYIPYYTCDAILQPLEKLQINYSFFYLNDSFTPIINRLKNKDEAILYTNYFGIFDWKIEEIKNKIDNLIIDNSQAFFAKPLKKTPSFYSPRKFFGVSDGGFAYVENHKLNPSEYRQDFSYKRISHLLLRLEMGAEAGFDDFKKNDASLDNLSIMRMSKLTEKLLRGINYEKVRVKRKKNFSFFHKNLKKKNELSSIIKNFHVNGPMVYPFLNHKGSKLRKILIKNKIFVAKYWPNIEKLVMNKDSFEYYLFNNLLPLPIDQRYNTEQLSIVLKVIENGL